MSLSGIKFDNIIFYQTFMTKKSTSSGDPGLFIFFYIKHQIFRISEYNVIKGCILITEKQKLELIPAEIYLFINDFLWDSQKKQIEGIVCK